MPPPLPRGVAPLRMRRVSARGVTSASAAGGGTAVLRSVSTGNDGGVSATVTAVTPGTTQIGDVVVVFHSNDFYALSNMVAPTATGSPTMNAVLNATADGTATGSHIKTWWYVANTGGAQTVSATETGTHDDDKALALWVYANADTTNPIDDSSNTVVTVSSGTNIVTGVSPTSATAQLAIHLHTSNSAGTASYTPPGSMTEQYDIAAFTRFTGASESLSASGATGTRTFTPASSVPFVAVAVAIKGAAGASPDQNVTPSGVPTAVALGSPAITRGSVTVNANGIVSAEQFGSSTSSVLTQITASCITSTEQVGTPTLSTTYTINANGITSTEAAGSPAVGQSVTPSGIASAERFGLPSFTLNVATAGITSQEKLGSATVTPGAVTLNAGGIVSGEASGASTIVLAQSITAAAIASLEALGTPTISVGAVTLNPGSIISGEGVGNAQLGISVTPASVPSNESVGSPTITVAAAGLSAGNIASSEQFGTPTITTTITVTVNGIRTEERIGNSALFRQVLPGGVVSGEKVGSPSISVGAATINAKGIISQEAFGRPIVTVLPLVAPTPDTLIRFRTGQSTVAVEPGNTLVQFADPSTLVRFADSGTLISL